MRFSNEQDNILDKIGSPITQAIFSLSLGILIMVVGWLLSKTGAVLVDNNFYWLTAGACTLLYAMFNSMISVSCENIEKYWFRAIPTYFALMFSLSILATLLSGIQLTAAGSYAWIFFMLTFGYLSFLSIARFIKRILAIATREEERVRREERKRSEQGL